MQTQQPERTVNRHMSPADQAHWDLMNSWFQRSFVVSFDDLFKANIEPLIESIAEIIESNHTDTLMLAALLRSVIGISRHSVRPDISNLNEVQTELDALRKELGIKIEEDSE
jgi:hypothetical protein